MKRRLLASFLLGFLLVMNALSNSSARVFLGLERNKNRLEVTNEFAQKESSDGTEAAPMRKLGLGGSKFLAHKDPTVAYKNEKEARGRTSKISGKEDDALKKCMGSLLEHMNDEKEHMAMLEPKALKFTKFAIPRSNFSDRNQKCYCSQYFNARMEKPSTSRSSQRQISEEHPHYSQGTTQKDEAKNVYEAAKEIVNLIHKDYKGMGSRKPPINNDEPRN